MKVWGLNPGQIHALAADLGLDIDNGRRDGRAYAFRIIPLSSRSKYSRRSAPSPWNPNGRRLVAACYPGFRDFIRACFRAGATRVKSTQGDWSSPTMFNHDLLRLRTLNVGSQMYPATMDSLCGCEL